MKKLSDIAAHHEMTINKHGIAVITLSSGVVNRKVNSKPFSNHSVDTVRIDGAKYLIDSRMDVTYL